MLEVASVTVGTSYQMILYYAEPDFLLSQKNPQESRVKSQISQLKYCDCACRFKIMDSRLLVKLNAILIMKEP